MYVRLLIRSFVRSASLCERHFSKVVGPIAFRGSRGHDHMVVEFTTTCSTTKVVSSNPVHGEVYSLQHYLIKLVSDFRQVSGFLQVLRFPPLIILTTTISLKYYTPTHRVGAILQSPCPSVRTFTLSKQISTSCLQCDLEFFMFAVMKTFVTVISASTGRNNFIFDIWLWHGDLYRVSPFQVYRISTSCLPCDLQMNEWGYS